MHVECGFILAARLPLTQLNTAAQTLDWPKPKPQPSPSPFDGSGGGGAATMDWYHKKW